MNDKQLLVFFIGLDLDDLRNHDDSFRTFFNVAGLLLKPDERASSVAIAVVSVLVELQHARRLLLQVASLRDGVLKLDLFVHCK